MKISEKRQLMRQAITNKRGKSKEYGSMTVVDLEFHMASQINNLKKKSQKCGNDIKKRN